MKKYLSIFAAIISLSGCTTRYSTYDEHGNTATMIQCPYVYQFRCRQEAENLCPNGYTVKSKQNEINLLVQLHTDMVVCKKGR